MEDNTVLIVLGVILLTIIYGAYSGLVIQYPNVLILLMGAVIVYLGILWVELRQLSKIAESIDKKESLLTQSVKELKSEIDELRQAAN
jgi:hypothetical protein